MGKRCVNNKAPDKQKGDYCPSFILIQKRHDFHLHCQHMESQEKIPRMLQNSDSAFTCRVAILVPFIRGKPQLATSEVI